MTTSPDEACNLVEQALSTSQDLEIEINHARCCKIQGIAYLYNGEHENALAFSLKALALYEDTQDKIGLSATLNAIGVIFAKRLDHDSALKYYFRALEIREKVCDTKGIASTTNNIANIYRCQEDFDRAQEFVEKSLQYFIELKDDLGIASSCNNLGTIMEQRGDFASAEEKLFEAFEIFDRIEYKTGLAAASNNLGELFTIQGKFKQARKYLDIALKTAKNTNIEYREIQVYENYTKLYEETGDFKGALEYFRKFTDLSQKVFSEESTENMNKLKVRFETERKKKEAEIYKLKNTELRNEISERIHIEKELRKHQDQLEELIDERTTELKNSYSKLARGFNGTIELISKIAELRDPYTSGHQIRVAELASAIAREMGLSEDRIEAVHIASLVHDIGKINVPQEILSKPGTLSDLEMKMIRIHPQAGYDILVGIDFPWPIAEIVREHHEYVDGSGYPQGLKTDEIALEARIICVADVIEAMSSHRPYRAILGIEEAMREITGNAGVLYDREVVHACKKVICENGFDLRSINIPGK